MRKRISDFDQDQLQIDLVAGWTYFSDILEILDIPIANAAVMFRDDYFSAVSRFDESERIQHCFYEVYATNKKKYDLLIQAYQAEFDPIENYNRIESSTRTREPDLESSTEGTVTRKQTRTVTDTPSGYTETDTHNVSPYDESTMKAAESNVRSFTGSRSTSETFTGQPDETSSTTTTTGTDTETFESTIHGNIGTVTSQQMLESTFPLAEKMNIFKVIEKDIAAVLLLQIWI